MMSPEKDNKSKMKTEEIENTPISDISEEESTIFTKKADDQNRKKASNKMKKGIIVTAVTVALAAIVLVLVLFFIPESEEGGDDSSSNTAYTEVISVNQDSVSKVSVENSKGSYSLVKDDADEWVAEKYEDIELSDAKTVVENASAVNALKKISGSAADKETFGFDDPSSVVQVESSEKDYTITVGSMSPDKIGYYICVSGSDTVYLVESASIEYFLKPVTDLVSTVALPAVTQDDENADYFEDGALTKFDSIVLSGTLREEDIVIECAPEDMSLLAYIVTAPGNHAANEENIAEIFDSVVYGLYNDGAFVFNPSESDIKKYGLDDPYSIVKINIGKTKIVLKFGQEVDGYYPFTVGDTPIIYKVSASSLEWVSYDKTDVYYENLFMEYVDDIDTFKVECEGVNTTFKLEHDEENDTFTAVSDSGVKLVQKQFGYYYTRVIALSAEEYLPTGTKAEGDATITFTITYTNKSKGTDVIRLVKYSERRYLFELNGSADALVSSASVDDLLENSAKLAKGEEISQPNI